MQTSDSISDLAGALAKAQGSIVPASKESENAAFKQGNKASKYANLASIWDACRKPLADNGLSVVQQVSRAEGGVAVTTRLFHASGQWIEFEPLTVPLSAQTAHAVGSATTYGRRFSLSAVLGIVADEDPDDDGNAASGKGGNGNAPASKTAPEIEHPPAAPKERTMTKEQARPEYDKIVKEIQAIQDTNVLSAWGAKNVARLATMPVDWQQSLKNEYADHKSTLMGRAAQ